MLLAIGILVLLAFVMSVAATLGLRQLALRVEAMNRAIESAPPPPSLALDEPEAIRPLQGLRVAISVSQDHPRAPFVDVLKEQLTSEDVAELRVLPPGAEPDWDETDILIRGTLACNGYAEVYYTAELTCEGQHGPVCAISEKPPHGDRPSNLALELATKLKTELERLVSRNERRRALRELSGDA